VETKNDMTTYCVQFVLPVDNPEKNVVITKRRGSYSFEVPINYKDAHNMGFMDLLAAAELSGLFRPSSTLNTDKKTENVPSEISQREQRPKKRLDINTVL